MLRELQEKSNNPDGSKSMQTNHLSSVLQQHLLSQLLTSPTPSSPPCQPAFYNNNSNKSNSDSFLERTARFQREAAGKDNIN